MTAFSNLNEYISLLEEENELIRINTFVNPVLEITEVTDRISKKNNGGKAILFENTGTKFPLLINAFGSEKRMCLALRVKNLDDAGNETEKLLKSLTKPVSGFLDKIGILPLLNSLSSVFPKYKRGRGECQQNIINNPDLSILPVLKCWPYDGGRFITLPMVVTKDPVTGTRNLGMYRMQILDEKTTGMHWHMHKTGARHFREYRKLGKKMPVSVVLGGDPIYTYAATAPLPDNFDEFIFAGALRKKGVEMVRCLTNELEVPNDADFVIEGYVDPDEELVYEGPFGDHTGFYSLADYYPRFHVTCITHRNNAVYPATIVGVPPMEDAWIGKATERIFLKPIRYTILPELTDIDLPFAGVAHNIALVKFEAVYPGHAHKVMNALWGAGQMMFNKVLIVFDNSVDIHNPGEVLGNLCSRFNVHRDVFIGKGPADILDHSSAEPFVGGKLFIDATGKAETESLLMPGIEDIIEATNQNDIEFNTALLLAGVPLLVCSVQKQRPGHLNDITDRILSCRNADNLRFIVYVNSGINCDNLFMVAWFTAGNIDPARDCSIVRNCLVVDGTIKTGKMDGFRREWPEVVISNDETISLVDKKWKEYGIDAYVPSPSIGLKKLVTGPGPVKLSE